MSSAYTVSTPSRLCLFGEHQDYLGLEVIATAIGLRFCAQAIPRKDALLRIRIRDAAALRQAGHRVTVQIKKVQLHSLLFYKVNAFSIQFSRGVPKRGTVTSTTSKRIKFSASSG